ncbi:transcriptional regulator, AraC family [Pseudomonas chlororaphis subsp. aureofaciens]|nr:transcriptional regulator, AraC family [Pseudomonas chlororaphis subsp. aureofaciens]AZE05770.1 transcriptional regulator, AraC family [Pseudomonas chlororaphis subsp. aureofaciens]
MADQTSFVQNRPMNDFIVVVPPGAFASSVTLSLDILSTASKLAPRLGLPEPRWIVCSTVEGPISLGGGLSLLTQRLTLPSDGRACWILPGLDVDDSTELESSLLQPEIESVLAALRQHVAAGGTVAASCSAVFLLHAAGLTEGKTVTTTWWLAATLRQLAAGCCKVDPDRMVIEDAPLVTAGAALGHTDLLMHLIGQRFGPELVAAVAKALLLNQRQLQSPFMVPALMAHGELIAQLIAHVEVSLPMPVSVDSLAEKMRMSTRTLSRRVSKATGHGPLHLIRTVQLNKARALLESSRCSVESVAEQVGFSDPTALRRLLKKHLNATPRQLR